MKLFYLFLRNMRWLFFRKELLIILILGVLRILT